MSGKAKLFWVATLSVIAILIAAIVIMALSLPMDWSMSWATAKRISPAIILIGLLVLLLSPYDRGMGMGWGIRVVGITLWIKGKIKKSSSRC